MFGTTAYSLGNEPRLRPKWVAPASNLPANTAVEVGGKTVVARLGIPIVGEAELANILATSPVRPPGGKPTSAAEPRRAAPAPAPTKLQRAGVVGARRA